MFLFYSSVISLSPELHYTIGWTYSFKYIIIMICLYFSYHFNTQNMRNSNLVYVLKMEYVHKVNIFVLKMIVKSGLEKINLKFLHAQAIFY